MGKKEICKLDPDPKDFYDRLPIFPKDLVNMICSYLQKPIELVIPLDYLWYNHDLAIPIAAIPYSHRQITISLNPLPMLKEYE